jgi:hypothetical protein
MLKLKAIKEMLKVSEMPKVSSEGGGGFNPRIKLRINWG